MDRRLTVLFQFRSHFNAKKPKKPKMDIEVNGKFVRLPDGSTVAHLLEQMALTGKRIAIERNREIIPKSQYADTVLKTGDRLEVVVAVGGG